MSLTLDFDGSVNKLLNFDMALLVVFKFNINAYDNINKANIFPNLTKIELNTGKKKTIIIIIILNPVIKDTCFTLSEKS